MADEAERQEGFFKRAGEVIASVSDAVMRDGTIKAMGRLGVDEIGMALRAFPESIQAFEPGTPFSPTQGEIMADRDHRPSPSEIANDDRPYQPDQSQGHDHGQDLSRGR